MWGLGVSNFNPPKKKLYNQTLQNISICEWHQLGTIRSGTSCSLGLFCYDCSNLNLISQQVISPSTCWLILISEWQFLILTHLKNLIFLASKSHSLTMRPPLTSVISEGAQGFFSKVTVLKSERSNKKNYECHSFLVKVWAVPEGLRYSVYLLIRVKTKKPVVHKFNSSNRLYSLMFSPQ